jgi:hypothetical protein
MNPILFFSLAIILSAALPWWPNSAYGRSRHHRPRDKQLLAYEAKVFDQRHEALQKAAMKLEALDRVPTPECDSNSQALLRQQFEKRWSFFERQTTAPA